jgi:hypothetical protein
VTTGKPEAGLFDLPLHARAEAQGRDGDAV